MPLYNPVTSATITDESITSADILNGTIALADLSATGTPSSSTYLRGDNTWATVTGSSGLGLTPTAVKTGNYTAAAGDFVPVDTTSGNVTVTFPTAPADGTVVAVKHVIRGGTNTVSLALGGSDKFNTSGGATSGTITLVSQGIVAQYKATGALWYVVADDLPLSGLDARYAQVSNNLSDVTAATARTNLGLGSAALISSTAGGDLSGTLPSPTVAKVNGVSVTGIPSSGQIPTATGSSAATWQTPVGAPQLLYTGGWYGAYGGASNGSTQYSADGVLHAVPIFIGGSVTLQSIGTNIATGGSAGSVVRLGIYAATSASNPFPSARVVDAGTIDSTSTGDKTLSISNALSPGLYWLVSASQGGAATQPIQRNIQSGHGNVGPSLGTGGPASNASLGCSFTGYTGALPSTFSAAGQTLLNSACATFIRAA